MSESQLAVSLWDYMCMSCWGPLEKDGNKFTHVGPYIRSDCQTPLPVPRNMHDQLARRGIPTSTT